MTITNEDFNLLPYLQGGIGKIYAVNTVSLSWIESDSGSDALLIVAEGEVISEGWKNPRLIPHTRIKEMPSGIWDFDFVADAPPLGIIRPALAPVRAEYLVTNVPVSLTGVRVHGLTKIAEIHLRYTQRKVAYWVYERPSHWALHFRGVRSGCVTR